MSGCWGAPKLVLLIFLIEIVSWVPGRNRVPEAVENESVIMEIERAQGGFREKPECDFQVWFCARLVFRRFVFFAWNGKWGM